MCYWTEDFKCALKGFILPEDMSVTVSQHGSSFTFELQLNNKDIGAFTFNSFGHIQDVMESCRTYVIYEYRDKGYAQLMQRIKRHICKKLPLSLVANISIYNEKQIHILKKFRWVEVPVSHLTHMWYLDHRSIT